jgi:SAM-dependent methyltransferase
VDRIDVLYRTRFPPERRRQRDRVWGILCLHYFQRFVREGDTILDLGCGFGEFSRFIRAGRKIAVDINPDAAHLLPPDVEFHQADARHLDFLVADSVDVCFTSNFFEHLQSKRELDDVLAEVRRVLRPGCSSPQPNINAPGEYWDYYDHLPLSHLSCAEAFGSRGSTW